MDIRAVCRPGERNNCELRAGEDASFDVEFTTRFKARIIIVDPTPRAIDHFEAIQKRLG